MICKAACVAFWSQSRQFIRRSPFRRSFICFTALTFLGVIFLVTKVLIPKQDTHALLFITPRSGGFNNQLITVYEAIRCAKKHGRTVVLPLIYENVRADTTSNGVGPFPFEDYFDVSKLERVVRTTTPARLDDEGFPCDILYFKSAPHFKANDKRVPRLLKQQYSKRYQVALKFAHSFKHPWRYVCVDDSLCNPPEEFGVYSDYHNSGQGYNIRASSALRQIRAAFHPSRVVQGIARHITSSIGGRYNAMHVRRGDFKTKCEELPVLCKRFGNYSFVQSREYLLQKAAEMREPLPIFISTTHEDECRDIFRSSSVRTLFMVDFGVPQDVEWALERTDVMSFASQIVASHAAQFVGNRFSSYTSEINNMRYLRDTADIMTFF